MNYEIYLNCEYRNRERQARGSVGQFGLFLIESYEKIASGKLKLGEDWIPLEALLGGLWRDIQIGILDPNDGQVDVHANGN